MSAKPHHESVSLRRFAALTAKPTSAGFGCAYTNPDPHITWTACPTTEHHGNKEATQPRCGLPSHKFEHTQLARAKQSSEKNKNSVSK